MQVNTLRPVAWVTDPALVKAVLLDRRDEFPKDPIGRRVLGPLIGNGILTAEGNEWRWQRRTVAPMFRHADLLDYVPAMTAAAAATIADWRAAGGGRTHAVDADMMRAAYQVISNTILAGGGEGVGAALEQDGVRYGQGLLWSMAYAAMNVPGWLPRPLRGAMRRRESHVREAVAAVIRSRREANVERDDLIDRLLAAAEPETGRRMSDQQLVDNLLTFLIAGHDTTAKALTWTLYLLAHAPDWQARLADEVGEVVGDGPVTGDHIDRLVLTRRVLHESMRLFPPVPVITRIALADTELGGAAIKAGTIVGVPIYAIHRHERLWDDPDRFDPDRFDPGRFAPEREAGHDRYRFMPFGGGPRVCVGAAFAMIEVVAIMATLVRAAWFEPTPGPPPVPLSRIVLTPKHGLPLRVTLRT